MKSIVVHYNELALKGKNRPWFIQLLVRNLAFGLTLTAIVCSPAFGFAGIGFPVLAMGGFVTSSALSSLAVVSALIHHVAR